jgi:hypothetical protein
MESYQNSVTVCHLSPLPTYALSLSVIFSFGRLPIAPTTPGRSGTKEFNLATLDYSVLSDRER